MSLVVSRQREAEIPLALMMSPHIVWPANSDVANAQRAHACAVIESHKCSEIPLARILHPHNVFLAGPDVANPQRAQACAVSEAQRFFHSVRMQLLCVHHLVHLVRFTFGAFGAIFATLTSPRRHFTKTSGVA